MTVTGGRDAASGGGGLLSRTAATLGLLTCAVALLPFFTESRALVALFRHLMAVALVLAIWLDAERRVVPIFVTSVAALDAVFIWTHPIAGVPPVLERLLTLTFLATTAGYLMQRLWRLSEVGISTVFVATGVYFMLGLSWGVVFSTLEMFEPGSFAQACLPAGDEWRGCIPELGRFPRLSYFSFVTMTTLGYGDVVPLTSPAEGLATMAAVTGQLFMAVLIGRLVGSFFSKDFANV